MKSGWPCLWGWPSQWDTGLVHSKDCTIVGNVHSSHVLCVGRDGCHMYSSHILCPGMDGCHVHSSHVLYVGMDGCHVHSSHILYVGMDGCHVYSSHVLVCRHGWMLCVQLTCTCIWAWRDVMYRHLNVTENANKEHL